MKPKSMVTTASMMATQPTISGYRRRRKKARATHIADLNHGRAMEVGGNGRGGPIAEGSHM